jgi:hypothetical protein
MVGKYRLSTGKGLVLGNSFTLGKLAALQNLGRMATSLRPHTSRSEADYLQGVATTLRLARPLRLTAYASHRTLDGTLDKDGQVTTLITSGYHRTEREMEKKNNTQLSDAGLLLDWKSGGWQVGFALTATRLNRQLQPDTSVLFRRWQAAGRYFAHVGASYGYTSHRLSFSGETAIDRHGHLATLNVLGYQPSTRWSLMALQRFYGYRYQSLRAHALSEGGHTQNESGLLVGATWRPLHQWSLQAYADYTYFPWARYQASETSEAFDILVASTVSWGQFSLKGRYRRRRQQHDDAEKTQLLWQTDHRARLGLTFTPDHSAWSLTTQADWAHSDGDGWMVSQNVAWAPDNALIAMTAAWFHTDGYDTRLYLHERQLPHSFSVASYSGHGLRLSLLTRLRMGRWEGHFRVGLSRYFDRSAIGSGLQQIDKKTQADLDFRLACRIGK